MAPRHEGQDPSGKDEDREKGSDQRSPGGSRSNVKQKSQANPESEGNLSDFTDQTSAGHHAGYGDYGQQDYGPHGEASEPTIPGSATSGDSVTAPQPTRRRKPAREPQPARERESKPTAPKTQADVGRSTPKTG